MGHWIKPEPEDYDSYETYLHELEIWRQHEEEMLEDYN